MAASANAFPIGLFAAFGILVGLIGFLLWVAPSKIERGIPSEEVAQGVEQEKPTAPELSPRPPAAQQAHSPFADVPSRPGSQRGRETGAVGVEPSETSEWKSALEFAARGEKLCPGAYDVLDAGDADVSRRKGYEARLWFWKALDETSAWKDASASDANLREIVAERGKWKKRIKVLDRDFNLVSRSN